MFLIILIIMMMKEYVGINHIMKGTLCGMEGGDFSIACNGTLPHISCPLGYAQYGSFGLFFCHANEVKNDLMDGLFCGYGNEIRCGPLFPNVQCPDGFSQFVPYEGHAVCYVTSVDKVTTLYAGMACGLYNDYSATLVPCLSMNITQC